MRAAFQTALLLLMINCQNTDAQMKRARDYGIEIGILRTGSLNAITDVPGVKVGQVTIREGDTVITGVTAILPHDGNIFQEKVPAGIFVANGFGKLTGYTQVEELGNLETPVILTNTLSVSTAVAAVVEHTLSQPGNETVMSVNAVVGETNDGRLNDIRGRHVTVENVLEAIKTAGSGPVLEGNVGAGTGTVCFGFKGGIGTASRKLPVTRGGYTVGVLVQTNYGGILQINGVPVGIELGRYSFMSTKNEYKEDGSCMIVVMTDAPLTSRNLKRLASRAFSGMVRTGASGSNGSGDYVIAASTAEDLRIPYSSASRYEEWRELRNDELDLLFQAAAEATEEAIINSLFAAETVRTKRNLPIMALPVDETLKIMSKYNRLLASCSSKQSEITMFSGLDSLLTAEFRADEPGGALLVMKSDSIIYTKCVGLADLKTWEEITPNTLFNLGSISKTFVANGILILQAEGKLSLSDPMSRYFLEFKNREIADAVTIAHLLTHTSGLPDNRPVSENPEFFITAKDYENFAPVMQAEKFVFAPGERYEYSNPAFNGLALIIEKVSGQKWQQFIAERIFAPAGMISSTITDGPHPESGVAHAYEPVNGRWAESDYGEFPTFPAAGNGGVWSSLTELALYGKALKSNLFLGSELTKKSMTIFRPETWAGSEPPFIGYSWFIGEDQLLGEKNDFGVRFVYHTGDQGGFRAFYFSVPEKDILYVGLFNRPPEDLNRIIVSGLTLLRKNNWLD